MSPLGMVERRRPTAAVKAPDARLKTADVACAGQKRMGELRGVHVTPPPIDKLKGVSGV